MPRILVVEDDVNLAEGIRYALEKEGFLVDLAGSVKDAQYLLNDKIFDLMILDVMLPDGSGYDLCRRCDLKKTPAIFLSACDEEVNIVMGLDLGGDDYITKPFRIRELISRIKVVLRRKSVQTAEDIEFGSLRVCTRESKVYKSDEPVFLTALEYRLLIELVTNPLKVFSRTALLSAIWDTDGSFADDNTLSVYIRRLREKIEDDPKNPQFIETVRGMGYRFRLNV